MIKRSKLIKVCDKLTLDYLRLKRGNRCEIHEGRCKGVTGKFHILPVSTYPRLRFIEDNILLSCWFSSHFIWHHDFFKAKEIEKRIIELRGKDYKEKLLKLEMLQPKQNLLYLESLKIWLEGKIRK